MAAGEPDALEDQILEIQGLGLAPRRSGNNEKQAPSFAGHFFLQLDLSVAEEPIACHISLCP